MFDVAIVTISDSGYAGSREDVSGATIESIVTAAGYNPVSRHIIPDDLDIIEKMLCSLADDEMVHLILTTGGTGFSPRDNTPEATQKVCSKAVPGIPEAMRAISLKITPRAMLSRAVAGIRDRTLIVNLPGSPKAVSECLEYILPSLTHGLEILLEKTGDCARK